MDRTGGPAEGVCHPASPMSRRLLVPSLVLVAGLAACGSTNADPGAPATTASQTRAGAAQARGVRLAKIGSFDQPLYVTAPPGDRSRVFVVEQPGRIRVVKGGKTLSAPFLDVSGAVSCCGERGLLSLAFAPDYATSGRFYVDYTDKAGDTRVVEYRAPSPDRADPSTARTVLAVDQPEPNHNGGLLVFGPDGELYVGLGDGGGGDDQHGSRGNGQNVGVLLGKILRIDPRRRGSRPYTVPASNPFTKRSGARPEIWSWGLRNPWRFSFDRRKGDLVIGDVGQDTREEIDFAPRSQGAGRGVNYGWRPREGAIQNPAYPSERAKGAVSPVLDYPHTGGRCSITGGYVVRDRGLSLYGRYVYGDYCEGTIYSVRLRPGRARDRRPIGAKVPGLSSFGEDAAGRVYVTSQAGPVYRIVSR
jgi:glucose/arabinose dehydrogenase